MTLELVYDVSGSPGKTLYFGLASFSYYTKDDVLNDFEATFPDYQKEILVSTERENILIVCY